MSEPTADYDDLIDPAEWEPLMRWLERMPKNLTPEPDDVEPFI